MVYFTIVYMDSKALHSDTITTMSDLSMPGSLPRMTLIVATTPSLGIGCKGSLPWGSLRADMAFFKRVTTRIPSSVAAPTDMSQKGETKAMNAVIMGRKTWDSIPTRFRPLSGRINVIVSRNPQGIEAVGNGGAPVLAVGSLEEGLRTLQERESEVERIFCIGGAQMYEEAINSGHAERVLRTKVMKDYQCDVFFPSNAVFAGDEPWTKQNDHDLDEWTGEEQIGAVKNQGDVEFQIEMWKRRS